jgi:hypothetical protein
MKNTLFVILILLVLTRCETKKEVSSIENELITVDLEEDYENTIVSLSLDIDSSEYIPLETNKDFLCGDEGKIIAFTDEFIIFSNEEYQGGDILIFNRHGKALKKVNRRGQSNEEYIYKSGVVYDDYYKEFFIYDDFLHKIFIYDMDGNYKRSFKYRDNVRIQIDIFDNELLMVYEIDGDSQHPVFLISKQTGEKIFDINIPFKKRIVPYYYNRKDNRRGEVFIQYSIRDKDKFILNELSSDTLFMFDHNKELKPVIIRTPSVNEQKNTEIFVADLKIGDYLFMTSYNLNILEYGFLPKRIEFLYDITKNKFYKMATVGIQLHFRKKTKQQGQVSLFDDYSSVYFNPYAFVKDQSSENNYICEVNASFLTNKNNTDNYSEKYQSIRSNLREDDNPVVIKFKFENRIR